MIVSFTGHRPDKLGGYSFPNETFNYVTAELKKILRKLQPEKAVSGMALGWDQWAAEICIELHIPFIAAVPFAGQDKIWPQGSKIVYEKILKQAEEVIIVSDGGYSPAKMQIRNEWMVNHCDAVVACFDGTKGGTYNCVEYAKKCGKEIFIINPKNIVQP